MTYYRENPNLIRTKVRTVKGDIEYLVNCRKYLDGYYVKGVDLQEKDGAWIKKGAAKGFDYELQKDVENVNFLEYGAVAVDENTGLLTYGYFTANPYKNCAIVEPGQVFVKCIDYKLLLPKHYIEEVATGMFHNLVNLSVAKKRSLLAKGAKANFANNVYNIEDNEIQYKNAVKLYEKSDFPIDTDLKYAGRHLGQTSFGIELETINGALPPHLMNTYGIVICKDGSIKGDDGGYPPEYVSVPYKGAKGLQAIRNITKEIQKRSEIDIKCSYHLHLGGFKIDRTLMISVFQLCRKIQKDIFAMFPYYKLKPKGLKVVKNGQDNYCKRLPNVLSSFGTKNFNKYINDSYSDFYTFLSGGHKPDAAHNVKIKNNPWGPQKWNIMTRYYWVNFVNPIFGKRDTIEFRLHTPTLNSDKIINWLFICNAIVKYAEANTENCINTKKVTLAEVLGYYKNNSNTTYGHHLSEKLNAYYTDRVAYFAKDFAENDYMSRKEMEEDEKFEFNITKIK